MGVCSMLHTVRKEVNSMISTEAAVTHLGSDGKVRCFVACTWPGFACA